MEVMNSGFVRQNVGGERGKGSRGRMSIKPYLFNVYFMDSIALSPLY